MVERKEYLERIKNWREEDVIKVVTGINVLFYNDWFCEKFSVKTPTVIKSTRSITPRL